MADTGRYLAALRKSAPFLYSNPWSLFIGFLIVCSPRLIVTQIAPLVSEATFHAMIEPVFLHFSWFDVLDYLAALLAGGFAIRMMVALYSKEPAMPHFLHQPYALVKASFAYLVLRIVYVFYLFVALLPLALVKFISGYGSTGYVYSNLALNLMMPIGGLLVVFLVLLAMAVYAAGGSLPRSADIRQVIDVAGDNTRVTLTAFLIVTGISLLYSAFSYAILHLIAGYDLGVLLAWATWIYFIFDCLSFLMTILQAYVVMIMFLVLFPGSSGEDAPTPGVEPHPYAGIGDEPAE